MKELHENEEVVMVARDIAESEGAYSDEDHSLDATIESYYILVSLIESVRSKMLTNCDDFEEDFDTLKTFVISHDDNITRRFLSEAEDKLEMLQFLDRQ